ncbi:MAG: ferrous iron transport protein B [Actinobacteria bacterium]|nr:ferrous iron transport protein B [Actinomycetota bacterium]
MHDHGQYVAEVPAGARRIVLAGNPNVGKSVFFNALTGMYVDVSNYPGTTVEVSSGRFGSDVLFDTPGIYGVSSFNDEEKVARDVILTAGVVVNVVDAVHLDRDLFLTLQIIDMGLPVVVALNMMDEVRAHGLDIDVKLLSEFLGVEVVPTVAVRREGFDRLREAIPRARAGRLDPDLEAEIEKILPQVCSRPHALMVLEDDPCVAADHGLKVQGRREKIYLRRRERADLIVARVLKETSEGASLNTVIGRLMLKPVIGFPILALVLVGMYYLIGVFVAQTVVDITERTWMELYWKPFIAGLVTKIIPAASVPGRILIGQYGLLTMTLTYLIGLLLPLVLGFYLFLSAMEDSGYLPRVAVLMDRALSAIGLNGRAIIPIILGFGCVTMATITTRLLGTSRERTIATFLLALTIPCSAQLAVISAMVAPLGPKFLGIYVLIMLIMFVLVGTVLSRLLPGTSSDLLIDLPPLRLPRLDNVLKKTATKSMMFLTEAGPLFIYGALAISVMQILGLLDLIQTWVAPITVGWLGLPKEAATAFIMGVVRRDFGAAGLYALPLTVPQTLVALVTITLFVPCIASIMVITKERGKREGVMIWASTFVIAFFVGGIVARVVG